MFTVSHIGAMTVAARLAHTASPGCLGDLNRIPRRPQQRPRSRTADRPTCPRLVRRRADSLWGAGPLLAAADEAQIKIAEASPTRYPAYAEPESFLHGPQVQIRARPQRLIAFAADNPALNRTRQIASFLRPQRA